MSLFEVNSDISRAETLVSDFYTDEKYFHESKEKIFARSWQLVGTTDEIDNLKPLLILEDFLDEPVLITKDGAKLDCISNVCTHRGKILIEKPCQMRGIRCDYHGRRFALDGKFLSMPEFEGAANFPREKDNLPKIPFGIWKNFLFAALNPLAPLAGFTAEIETVLNEFDFESLRFVAAKDYTVKAHWALYCENYLEGFHVPFVHESLNQAIDYGSYTTELFRFSSLQTAQARLPENAPVSREQAFDFDKKTAAFYLFVFPNLMLNFYPWGLSINIVKPLKPDLTKVSYLTFVSDKSKLNTGAGANLETVEFEDQAVVESVQRGIRSRLYSTGRYSPTREQGTHHFHRLIAEFMN